MSEGDIKADALRLYIERIETLTEEKKGISDDIKDVFAEAKSTGYDTKGMRHVIRQRAKDKAARDEERAIQETYEAAMGIA